MTLPESQRRLLFRSSSTPEPGLLTRVPAWLDRLPLEVALAVSADMAYLLEYGRDAALPYVRHRVQSSAHFRTESQAEGRRWVIRVLACFANRDQAVAFCVAGDKATWEARHPGEDWYEAHVPVADRVFNMMRKERGWQ